MFRIALIGPDGCGKTTVATKIERALPWPAKYVYMGVSLESSNLMLPTSRLKLALRRLAKRPSDTAGPRDPNRKDAAPKGVLRRALRFMKRSLSFVNQVAEESYRQLVVAWHLVRGRVVLLDRDFFADYYAYDIAAPNRPFFRRLHGWLLTHLYRKPDLVIYLDVSGETMFARKGEGSIELLNRRCDDYRELRSVIPSFVSVDAEQPLSDVIEQVQRHIARLFQEQHNAREAEKTLAIVVGADCVTGLQTGRALARRGIPVVGIAAKPDHFCCQSNAFRRVLQCDTGDDELIELFRILGPALPSKAVLFPCTDLSVLKISEQRAAISAWYHCALPSHEMIHTLTDKLSFARHAEVCGTPYPRFRSISSLSDAHAAARELTFPCYLKPAVKTKNWERHTKHKAFVVACREDFLEKYHVCASWTDRLLLQEAILGPETNHYTCDLYFDRHGRVSASFGSRKLRCWPHETGTACFSVEEACDELREKAIDVFRGVSYHGPAYVELKRDSRTGDDLVIETNVGRPTGRSAAAAASGVDLTYTMYCDLLQLPTPSNQQMQNQHRKWIHLRRDLLSAVHKWRSGKLSLHAWCRSLWGHKQFAVFSLRDPGPFIAELKRYTSQLFLQHVFRERSKRPEYEHTGIKSTGGFAHE